MKSINRVILAAAALATFTAALHVFAGTLEIAEPLLRSNLHPPLRLLLYACWHLVSITLSGSAVALWTAARQPQRHQLMARFVSWLWICFGLVFIAVDLGHSGPAMLLQLPQWSLLLPVGLLGLWGTARR